MSPQLDLNALVTGVCDVARQAGEAILAIYNQDFSVAHKQDRSPVTEADLHAHYVVAKGLAALTPAIPILSEEGESTPYSERREWQTFWLVDPLDGTREFIKRNGEFTVNVSLISGASAILGVVYSPVQDTFYYAYEGGGAYKRCRDAPETLIKVRPWAGKHITLACSRSRAASMDVFMAGFESYDTIILGSAMKSCVVAEGRADVYARFGPTSEWDTAAAQCILEQAGGGLVDLTGQPLRYNQRESLLNPSFLAVGDLTHDWQSYLPDGVV